MVAVELPWPPAFGIVGGLIQKMGQDASLGSLSEHHNYGIHRLKEKPDPLLLLPRSLVSQALLNLSLAGKVFKELRTLLNPVSLFLLSTLYVFCYKYLRSAPPGREEQQVHVCLCNLSHKHKTWLRVRDQQIFVLHVGFQSITHVM